VERAFTAEQRAHTTILFGGFTWKHENLIRAVFQGCGYRCEKLPVPDVPAFQIGKEFGNNGQCNPTYFTVGNLVQYLQFLEKEGLTRQQILDNYVFFTAGSCGPCRFGMYEADLCILASLLRREVSGCRSVQVGLAQHLKRYERNGNHHRSDE
jgi:predicted nucleotide-binding protein (sugar kinase/HSP70/actin superfamily)